MGEPKLKWRKCNACPSGKCDCALINQLIKRAEDAEAEVSRLRKQWQANATRAEDAEGRVAELEAEIERLRGLYSCAEKAYVELYTRAEKAEAEVAQLRGYLLAFDNDEVSRLKAVYQILRVNYHKEVSWAEGVAAGVNEDK